MALLPYLIAIPLASAFLIPLFARRMRLAAGAVACLGMLALLCVSGLVASSVVSQKALMYNTGALLAPAGILFVADSLSALLSVTMNLVAFLVLIYATDYIRKYTDRWKFYSLFMLMVSGINGVLIAGDIFNLYVFLEIAAISGYFLVAFGTGADELEAAFKYAVMGSVASIFIFVGIAFLYSYTSTLNMADMATVIAAKGPSRALQFVAVLFLMGFGLKAALVPFHSWLPYAHSSAPAPISAMLSGVSIKVLGIYALSRILFNVFGMSPAVSGIVIGLGVVSMVVGSIMAFGQSDIKRLFAYSSISQIGYVALGIGIGTPLSILGALFHLFNHSIFKSLLFLDSGSIERITGSRDMNEISGIAKDAPVTGYTSLVGALSICGIPPFGGFWSKFLIILACVQANHPLLAFTAVIVSILTLVYYFRALAPVLFGKDRAVIRKGRISPAMGIPMVILAALSAVSMFMLMPNPGNTLLNNAVAVLANGKNYAAIILGVIK